MADVHPGRLRRSQPSHRQGKHPKYIRSQMGHSSINVTMDIYRPLMDTVNQKGASRLGRTVLGKEDDAKGHNGSKMGAGAGE